FMGCCLIEFDRICTLTHGSGLIGAAEAAGKSPRQHTSQRVTQPKKKKWPSLLARQMFARDAKDALNASRCPNANLYVRLVIEAGVTLRVSQRLRAARASSLETQLKHLLTTRP